MRGSRRDVAEAWAREFAQPAPPGWSLARLGDVAELQPGYAFDSDWFATTGVRLLRGTNIVPGGTRWDDVVHLPFDRIDQFDSFRLKAGDIVIAMDRPFISTGLKVARLAASDCPALLLQRVGRFIPTTAIFADYLHYYLNGSTFATHVGGLATGTQLPHISKTDIETCPILVPPAHEQRRIVAKLDAIFEQTRAAKARLERLLALLEKFKRSILDASFRGDLTADWRAAHPDVESASALLDRIRTERRRRWESDLRAKGKDPVKVKYDEYRAVDSEGMPKLPPGWSWVSLGQMFVVEVGATPSRGEPSYWNGGVPWVSSGEVAFCRILSTREFVSQKGLLNSSTKLQPTGTVLLGMIGEGKTRGQVAILDIPACTNQNVAAIRVSDTNIIPEYIYFTLAMQYELTRRIGSGNNQQALNKSRVEAMAIPLAPLEEQLEIVRLLHQAHGALAHLQKRVQILLEKITALEGAALDKAFRGELVPQDPNDEPAAILIDRIRAVRRGDTPTLRRERGLNPVDAPTSNSKSNGHRTAASLDDSLDLVVAALQHGKPRITAAAITDATNLDAAAVKQILKSLVTAGQVRVHGKARGTSYEWIA